MIGRRPERPERDRVDLSGIHAPKVNLVEARLDGAILAGVCLDRASLCGTALEGAILARAALRGADLFYAALDGASLPGAALEGANLRGVRFAGAYLAYAEGLTAEQLREAVVDESTRLPQGLAAEPGFSWPEGGYAEE